MLAFTATTTLAFSPPLSRAGAVTRPRAAVARMVDNDQGIEYSMVKDAADWKSELGEMEYRVLREKGTERPGTGEYNKFYPKDGHFVCAAPSCATPLYSAAAKFDSGCGWPAFDKIVEGSVVTQTDMSMGMKRIEIMCAKCGGHLGHVFEGERFTETNERHCVNSVSVKYVDAPLGEDVSEVKAVQPGTLPKKSDEGVSSLLEQLLGGLKDEK